MHAPVTHTATMPSEKSYGKQAWIVCLCAALFFFYEFIQMNLFDAISVQLMHAFSINATQLGAMSSYYFIANVVFLFAAGYLLDRFSARWVILSSLSLCILGTALFAFSTSAGWATFFRFLTGIGSAFCFLSCVRLASRWFPFRRMALVTGMIVTMAMLGGVAAETPMTLLVNVVNWRTALLIDAALGVFIWFLIAWVVCDYPPKYADHYQHEQAEARKIGYWKSLKLAFLKLQNWLGGIYTCMMNLPLSLLGGLWGILYVTKVDHIPQLNASFIVSMLFIGTIIGSPLVGWLSDRTGSRRKPMLAGATASLILVFVLMLFHQLPLFDLAILFLLIGITTSAQIISYPAVAENSLPAITAMSVSVVNISCQGGQALFQPLFGELMDLHLHHAHATHNAIQSTKITLYSASDFTWAMWLLPVGFGLAWLAAFSMDESYCESRAASDEVLRQSEATAPLEDELTRDLEHLGT